MIGAITPGSHLPVTTAVTCPTDAHPPGGHRPGRGDSAVLLDGRFASASARARP